jgi:hypothetical protein
MFSTDEKILKYFWSKSVESIDKKSLTTGNEELTSFSE